ncbi:MAG TPA: hypothetical protein VGQ87_00260 [Patescibacteria group bacterium]|jgi:heme O synthase-like polyprenyltransferase|nr:hypothetical protein [Patescibacteria group bacterium]
MTYHSGHAAMKSTRHRNPNNYPRNASFYTKFGLVAVVLAVLYATLPAPAGAAFVILGCFVGMVNAVMGWQDKKISNSQALVSFVISMVTFIWVMRAVAAWAQLHH